MLDNRLSNLALVFMGKKKITKNINIDVIVRHFAQSHKNLKIILY